MRTSLLVAMAAAAIFVVVMPALARAKGERSPSPTQAEIGLDGGFFQPVDINDPYVQEIGRWAVSEHVKKANDGLIFNRVVGGQYQVVEGFYYRLIVDTTNGRYEAGVWEKKWQNFRQLTSFNLVS